MKWGHHNADHQCLFLESIFNDKQLYHASLPAQGFTLIIFDSFEVHSLFARLLWLSCNLENVFIITSAYFASPYHFKIFQVRPLRLCCLIIASRTLTSPINGGSVSSESSLPRSLFYWIELSVWISVCSKWKMHSAYFIYHKPIVSSSIGSPSHCS